MTPDEYREMDAKRARRKLDLQAMMEAAVRDADELARHPRPWRWIVTYHDGLGFQFIDANGKPCLQALIPEPECAALILHMVNSIVRLPNE